MEILPLKQEDVPSVKAFLFKVIEEDFGYQFNPAWHSDIANLERVYLQDPRSYFLVGWNGDGSIAGTIAIRKYPNSFPEVNHLYDDRTTSMVVRHFVSRSQRNKGVGSQLLKDVEAYARESGVNTLYLHTQITIPGSLEYWLAKGYKVTLDTKNQLGTVHLEKHLPRVE
ncbi:acyl-CoA N-acyltransferase [Basidiobolus meristosporus CBS 931.73]|uniref:Acyl-CoA N-acyltransferase n=1 Tax=Basidiobolus meristosporus CBS 931.73 TaxID=1314790 RepID=A0A1Y1XVA5_9FUNG|nr:acyl-CoA N-acyltransferase [Basidiobolus meristosporus CBS 931.73]|eukprot:ORX89426.1 acyl-CoA N-acyltransferase [Basidiobolus meristosporus CBS 931.73]